MATEYIWTDDFEYLDNRRITSMTIRWERDERKYADIIWLLV